MRKTKIILALYFMFLVLFIFNVGYFHFQSFNFAIISILVICIPFAIFAEISRKRKTCFGLTERDWAGIYLWIYIPFILLLPFIIYGIDMNDQVNQFEKNIRIFSAILTFISAYPVFIHELIDYIHSIKARVRNILLFILNRIFSPISSIIQIVINTTIPTLFKTKYKYPPDLVSEYGMSIQLLTPQ